MERKSEFFPRGTVAGAQVVGATDGLLVLILADGQLEVGDSGLDRLHDISGRRVAPRSISVVGAEGRADTTRRSPATT